MTNPKPGDRVRGTVEGTFEVVITTDGTIVEVEQPHQAPDHG